MLPRGVNHSLGPSDRLIFGLSVCLSLEEGKLDPVVGREAQIDRVLQILNRRTKNNPCLVGLPGVWVRISVK